MLLEGGPRLAGSFLDAGEVDEMRIFIAPIAVGGRARARCRSRARARTRSRDAQQAHVDVDVRAASARTC